MAKVYILAGHGGKDPGAVAYSMKEKEITLVMAKKCKAELERHGVQVIMGRTTDVYLEFAEEVAPANKNDVDVALFIHVNAGGGDGSEAFYYPGSVNGKKLAELCEKHVKAIGQNSRGVKTASFYVLKHTNMPAVLTEAFFIDNDVDNNIGDTKAEQEKFGVAYAKALLEYLGITYKAPVAASPVKNTYSLKQFVTDIQKAFGAGVDGIAGPETLSKTITLSENVNYSHKAVKYVQKRLYALGFTEVGTADGIAGTKFTKAVKAFQKKNGCYADGEITAKNKTWKKLLGME